MKSICLLKRVPNLPFLIFAIIIAGVAEGIGISVLIPLASVLTSGDGNIAEMPSPFNKISEIYKLFDIDPNFKILCISAFVIMTLSFVIIFVQDTLIAKSRASLLKDMRSRAAGLVFKTKWDEWSKFTSGDIANVIIHESEKGSESLLAFVNVIAQLIQLFAYMIIAFLLSWKMCLIAIIVIIISAVIGIRLIRRVRTYGKLNAESNTSYSKLLVEFVRGGKLIKAIGLENFAKLQLLSQNFISATAHEKILINSSKMRLELQTLIGFAMVVILYTAVTVIKLPTSTILVFMFIIMRLAPKFVTLQGQYHSYSAHLPSFELFERKISEIENLQEQIIEDRNNHIIDDQIREITLKDISYRYPTRSEYALKNINLKIKAKEYIAFVGKSGSGKSTLLDMIMGLLSPTNGEIYINKNDYKIIHRSWIQKKIGYVSQDSIFFVGSILENLKVDREIEIDKVWGALDIAQLSSTIKNLPMGLDTQIGEAGILLSGGQKQRLAIARALLRSPELLILDEATSALDTESELAFQNAVDAISNQVTIIVVAHRFSTIKNADKIFVFENGQIVQIGSFTELSKIDGPFKDLNSIK